MTFVLHPLGPQFEPLTGHKVFSLDFCQLQGVEVRILFKNGNFSTAVNSHETFLSVLEKLSFICPIKEEYRRVPELGQKMVFINFY